MKVGFGRTDITPPLGTLLGGQLHEKRATYVESNLHATAMCIEDSGGVTVLISCDLLVITSELAAQVKDLVSSRLPIAPNRVFISATHTHSGPITVPLFGMQAEGEYLQSLPEKVVSAIEQAYNTKTSCSLRACAGHAHDISFNRRFLMRDGTVHTHPLKGDSAILEPEGPNDPEVGVLAAVDAAGQPLGGFVNFACHATVLDRYDTGLSADYPGYVYQTMEHHYSRPTTWLFLNGACGDLCQVDVFNPGRKEVGSEWARHMGKCIAQAATQAIENGVHSEIESLAVTSAVVAAPFRRIPDSVAQDARRWLGDDDMVPEPPNQSNYGVEHVDSSGEKVALEDIFSSLFWEKFYAREILTLKQEGEKTPIVDVPVGVIKSRDFALLTVPAELFAEWGLRMKRESPFKYTFVAELTNGYVGYIPTEKAFSREGGYETKYVTSTKLAPQAGRIVTAKLLRMLES